MIFVLEIHEINVGIFLTFYVLNYVLELILWSLHENKKLTPNSPIQHS